MYLSAHGHTTQETYLSKLNSCHEKDSTIWQEMKQIPHANCVKNVISFDFLLNASMVLVMTFLESVD